MSLTLKFALFTSLLCLAIIGGIIFVTYRISYEEFEVFLGQRLEAIASSGALTIDGTEHDKITSNQDAESLAFQTIRDHLRDLKRVNQLDTEIYTFRRVGEKLQFVVMTNEKPFVGDSYSIRPEMWPTLNNGQTSHTGVYGDEHGMWISAYAPILDQNGQLSGMLEVDFEVHTFLALLRKKFISLIWGGLFFSALAVLFSFLLARTVTRKLIYLAEVTEKISLGKLDTQIKAEGRDEVSRLGAALERMRESLVLAAKLME